MFEPRLGFLIEVEIISVFHILFILFFADGRNAFWSRTSEGGFPLQQIIIMIKPIYFGVDPTKYFLAYFLLGFFCKV